MLYLRSSHHHQGGPNLAHHSADQLSLAHTRRPHQEHTSGTGHTQRAQGARIQEGQLQHLLEGCIHLKYQVKNRLFHESNKYRRLSYKHNNQQRMLW